MTVCIYHNDNDGRCAAAITWHWLRMLAGMKEPNALGVVFVEATYDKRDEIVDSVAAGDEVFILDFSFTREQFERLAKKVENITWIDHHKSAIEALADTPFSKLRGVRRTSQAACLLTWVFLLPDVPIPEAVRLIADRDAWIWDFGKRSAEFHYGLTLFDTDPKSSIWKTLFTQPMVAADKLVSDGKIVMKALEQRFADLKALVAFDTSIVVPGVNPEDPKMYSVRAMNIAIAGSAAFGAPGWETGALPDDVDICCQYYHNGDVFTISLYSKKGGVDVSAICKSFGGGGHAGAAGFTSKELPAFLRKISDG